MKALLITALIIGTGAAEQLRITAYNKAHLPSNVIEDVAKTLTRMFHRSGIEIEWVDGVPGTPEALLMVYQPSVKGQEQALACRARRDIALDILPAAPPHMKEGVLGMSLPLASQGLNVRIFGDRVQRAADFESRPHAAVLAHAIAHEIGHVLLRSDAHTPHGLMSAMWVAREYQWMDKGSLLFTPDQSRSMRAALSGEGCAPSR